MLFVYEVWGGRYLPPCPDLVAMVFCVAVRYLIMALSFDVDVSTSKERATDLIALVLELVYFRFG